MNHTAVKGLHRLMVNISGDQSLAVRNGRPCVKSCDQSMSIHAAHMTSIMVMSLEERHAQAADTAHVILGKGPLNPFCM